MVCLSLKIYIYLLLFCKFVENLQPNVLCSVCVVVPFTYLKDNSIQKIFLKIAILLLIAELPTMNRLVSIANK